MPRRLRLALLFLLPALPLLALLRAPRAADAAAPSAGSGGERVPVLVELFTSEGCSSCPPADATLARIAHEQSVPGVEVIPLAWHVDYWDYIGWADPFASKASTARQQAYAAALGRGRSLYTPQAVVDGRAEMNGADAGAILRAVEAAARGARAKVSLAVRPDGEARVVTVVAGPLPAGAAASDVSIVVVDAEARVEVARGENAGRTLDHTAIAHAPQTIGRASGAGESRAEARIFTPKRPASVVAIVAESGSRKVWGVATVPIL